MNKGAKKMIGIGIGAFLLITVFYVAVNSHFRHYRGSDGQLYRALHIVLPGYGTIYYPEQEVDLSEWVGTEIKGLVATNTSDGTKNPEATAGLALKAIGLCSGCELEQRPDGHFVLHRPAREKRYFSWEAYYQIWPGRLAES